MSASKLFSLDKKVILITGANGQLCRAIAQTLTEFGAYLVLTDKVIDACRKTESKICKSGGKAISLEMDVTDKGSIEKCVDKVLRHFKKIDTLVNNAGMGVFTPFEKRTPEEFDKIMAINAKGAFLCSQVVSKSMIKRRKGNIVNIGSIYGLVAPDQRIYADSGRNCSEVYAMSKAAVIQLTKYLACYLSKYNIRVNCISPGGIFNKQLEKFIRNYSYKTPLRRMGLTKELSGALVYLSSDASEYVTGHNLIVDGGFTCW
jgi:NAD(P)-dependent dehydrogenase (short-subunit alcohol dehydrogenase family)